MSIYQRILFYFFVLIYLIFCPWLILYTFGFITADNLSDKGEIYFSTTPQNATIYIEGRRYSYKTPTTVKDILAGTYDIRLTLNKHKSWLYSVKIKSNQTQTFDKILFKPLDWSQKELLPYSFINLIPLPGTNFLILTKGERIEDHFIYNMQTEKLTPLIQQDSLLYGLIVLSYDIVLDSSAFILRGINSEGERIIWVRLKDYDNEVRDVSSLFSENNFKVGWDPREANYVFSLQQNNLNQMNINTGGIYPKFYEEARGYGFKEGIIYILNKRNILLRMDYSGVRYQILMEDPILAKFIFPENEFIDIKPLEEGVILFLSEGGVLTANIEPYRFAQEVLGITADETNMRIIFWQNSQIGLLDFRTSARKRADLEIIPDISLVYDKGSDIKQVFWVHQSSHLLIKDSDKIFLFDLLKGNKERLNPIISAKRNSSVYYHKGNGMLYYLDPSLGRLCSIGIVPKDNIEDNNK
ncbi:MAG: PEGA domain-containing protein [Candidatus Omnitrophica bacterium]|jgi:hypothetical protein|nr:PEGA domain-containing protein [Candidatus Omnitrophota bacterium]